ncbi:hypothetical protein SNEBB_008486 [Seison nebaliae]|nr:hypothetical protein SNEBB_008486 [Seison nebaliae]
MNRNNEHKKKVSGNTVAPPGSAQKKKKLKTMKTFFRSHRKTLTPSPSMQRLMSTDHVKQFKPEVWPKWSRINALPATKKDPSTKKVAVLTSNNFKGSMKRKEIKPKSIKTKSS